MTFHPVGPLYDDQEANAPLDEDVWELYNVREDLSETKDLAAQHPDLVAEVARERFRYFQGGAQVPETVAVNAVVETRGPVVRDPLAELEAILAEQ